MHNTHVTFTDLTIQNGYSSGYSGGIYQSGVKSQMHLLRTILRDNHSPGGIGGALVNENGRFVMEDSAVYGNAAGRIWRNGQFGWHCRDHQQFYL